MRRRLNLFIMLIIVLAVAGCIKQTYDMNKLSKDVHLSPSIAIAAAKGNILFSDIVKSSDTVIFGDDKSVRIKFSVDSVINMKLADFYNLTDMVNLTQTYTMGNLSISDFQGIIDFSLGQMSQSFPGPVRTNINKFRDGGSHPFPPIPPVTLSEQTFPSSSFTNFQNAVFSSGFMDIKITNSLPATLKPITLSLYNTVGHTTIASGISFAAIDPGETGTATIDLTGVNVTNSIIAGIVLSGSPGNPTPGTLDIDVAGLKLTIIGRNLKIKSGRVILPTQDVSTINKLDTIIFDPGSGIEMDELKIITGDLSYHIKSTTALAASLSISAQEAVRNGSPLSEVINVPAASNFNGAIDFSNTLVNMGTDPVHPYNRVPLVYDLVVSSASNFIDFDESDMVQLDVKLLNPVFDYAKGYFGQKTETIKADSLDLKISDVLKRLKGDFFISNPSIRLNYINSFAIPVKLNLTAQGKRNTKRINLDLNPVIVDIPSPPATKEISSFITIDKNNSHIDSIVSMPPEVIDFSGTVEMNPGVNDGSRNNYVFGDSRFFGALDIEIPLQFRMNNLQFADTLNNFLNESENGKDNSINPDNFESVSIILSAKNGFPLGVSVKMSLYNSVKDSVKSTITATDILKPAAVDANGKAVGQTETKTTLQFSREFFNAIDKSDKIIFEFTLNTSGNGAKDIVIYSDYEIDFTASLAGKADINLN